MLKGGEQEMERTGATSATNLTATNETAKACFLIFGGLDIVLGSKEQSCNFCLKVLLVHSLQSSRDTRADLCQRPFVDGRVLASCCSLLLNLSSYVPAQVDICDRAAFLLLSINKAMSSANKPQRKQDAHLYQKMRVPQVSSACLKYFAYLSPCI